MLIYAVVFRSETAEVHFDPVFVSEMIGFSMNTTVVLKVVVMTKIIRSTNGMLLGSGNESVCGWTAAVSPGLAHP